jgi:hypothetical protein
MTNTEVLEIWLNGQPARSKNLSTDGYILKSYSLEIARFDISMTNPVIYNHKISRTTSKHITQAIDAINRRGFNPRIINPNNG